MEIKPKRDSGGRLLPGYSANPSGRPKGRTLSAEVRKVMMEIVPGDAEGRTYLECFALATVQLAMQGHPQALKEIWGRMDGAIPQTIDITDKRGKPVITVNWGKPPVNGNGDQRQLPSGVPPVNGTSSQ